MRRFLVSAMAAIVVIAAVGFSAFEIRQRIPSAGDCADLWNRKSNVESQRAVSGFRNARVAGWDTKAGPHCSVHVFSEPGRHWVMFVLWVADPDGLPPSFHEDIGGKRYGRGELGAEQPLPANASVGADGVLTPTSPLVGPTV